MELTEDQFTTQVIRHLFKNRGLDLSGYSQSFVMRSIKKRIGRSGVSDYSAYLALLARSEDETNNLLGALSINVTEFFRDRLAFDAFAKEAVRPMLEYKVEGGGLMRIWSAGCATGQEAYSIAIIVQEELKKLKRGPPPMVSVTGTDISEAALAKAKSGVYTKEEIKSLPERYLSDYFTRKGEAYEASDSLRKGLRFVRENLLDPPSQKYFDIVVCRNVMIYFSRLMHDTVAMHLFGALRKGGYLMLGKTETLMGAPRDGFEVVDLENRILRRKV
jgi:chemotaxis methyl-accepting protein methylase